KGTDLIKSVPPSVPAGGVNFFGARQPNRALAVPCVCVTISPPARKSRRSVFGSAHAHGELPEVSSRPRDSRGLRELAEAAALRGSPRSCRSRSEPGGACAAAYARSCGTLAGHGIGGGG